MSFNFSPKIVTDGLVLYLDAANTKSYVSGSTTWNDISRGGNVGTLTNGPTFNSSNGGSIVFDGSNDFVSIPSSIILDRPKTMEVFIYINSNQTALVISRGTQNYEIYTYADGYVYTYWGNSFNTSIYNPPITLGTWNHFCFTLSGSTETVYKNGTLIGSRTLVAAPNYTDTGNVTLGSRNDGTLFYNGRLANIKLYNRVLTAAEVLQNYNTTKSRFGL